MRSQKCTFGKMSGERCVVSLRATSRITIYVCLPNMCNAYKISCDFLEKKKKQQKKKKKST